MEKRFRVSGMTCAGCENLVREALEELEGVVSVRASHSEGVVDVNYDSERINPAALVAVIGEQGFKVELPD